MTTRFGCHILMLAMMVAMIVSGCDQWPPEDPVRSAPEAPPKPINLSAQVLDRSLDLSWEISDSSTVAMFRIYRADGAEAQFYLFDSASVYVKTLSGLAFGQQLQFRVTAVSVTGIEGPASDAITAVAGLLSIALDGGNEYTRDRNVSVRLTAPGPTAYAELSEDPLLADATVQSFAAVMPFEVSQGDGLKTIYARITFADGSVAGEILSDDIVLDTYAHIDSIVFAPTGQVFSAGDTISFMLGAGGETGGTASALTSGVIDADLRDDGVAPDLVADDGLYAAYYIVPVAVTITDAEITGRFSDAAGNFATPASAAERLTIQTPTPPNPVILAVALADSVYAHLTWTVNDDNDFETYRVYRSSFQNIDVGSDNLRIAIITQQDTQSFDDYLPDSGVYYYKIFVFNTQGASAASNEVAVTR